MTTAGDPFFLRELQQLGPQQPPQAWNLSEAQKYCKMWATRQYENFTVVSWLLPRRLRQDFYNIYAYCRWSDNLADEVQSAADSLRLLDWWNQQLQLCYSGRPAHPVMVALQSTVQQYHIPIAPFQDLLSAFRQDQEVTRYDDDAELQNYCERSANPVGRILLHLTQDEKAVSDQSFALSDSVCTGLQLANFCQDMERDAQIGRIYLPRSRWNQITEEQILARQKTPELQESLQSWVGFAKQHFDAGQPLTQRVPKWLAVDIELFIQGGRSILREIEIAQFDVWTKRPTVSKWNKLSLFMRAWLGSKLAWLPASRGKDNSSPGEPSHG